MFIETFNSSMLMTMNVWLIGLNSENRLHLSSVAIYQLILYWFDSFVTLQFNRKIMENAVKYFKTIVLPHIKYILKNLLSRSKGVPDPHRTYTGFILTY